MKTFIITHFIAVGDPIKIVVKASGRNKAQKAADELLSKICDYRVMRREFEVL